MNFTNHESERLYFRKFNEDDFPILYKWHNCAENMGYRRDGVKNEEETRNFMNWIISEANMEPCKIFWFAAVRKSDNILIGEALIKEVPQKPEYEIGWLVDKNHWGQGYGTEIGGAMLKYGFAVLNLHRIIAACHVDNHASYKLMEKLGMRREAHFIKSVLYGSEWCDRLQYAILREEWEADKDI